MNDPKKIDDMNFSFLRFCNKEEFSAAAMAKPLRERENVKYK